MNQPEIDALILGASAGVTVGTVIGYALRGLRESVRDYRTSHITKRDIKMSYGHDTVTSVKPAMPAFVSLPKHEQRTRRFEPDVLPDPDRDDVVAALCRSGYKKVVAVTATDACVANERATVEAWTVAALRRASMK